MELQLFTFLANSSWSFFFFFLFRGSSAVTSVIQPTRLTYVYQAIYHHLAFINQFKKKGKQNRSMKNAGQRKVEKQISDVGGKMQNQEVIAKRFFIRSRTHDIYLVINESKVKG